MSQSLNHAYIAVSAMCPANAHPFSGIKIRASGHTLAELRPIINQLRGADPDHNIFTVEVGVPFVWPPDPSLVESQGNHYLNPMENAVMQGEYAQRSDVVNQTCPELHQLNATDPSTAHPDQYQPVIEDMNQVQARALTQPHISEEALAQVTDQDEDTHLCSTQNYSETKFHIPEALNSQDDRVLLYNYTPARFAAFSIFNDATFQHQQDRQQCVVIYDLYADCPHDFSGNNGLDLVVQDIQERLSPQYPEYAIGLLEVGKWCVIPQAGMIAGATSDSQSPTLQWILEEEQGYRARRAQEQEHYIAQGKHILNTQNRRNKLVQMQEVQAREEQAHYQKQILNNIFE